MTRRVAIGAAAVVVAVGIGGGAAYAAGGTTTQAAPQPSTSSTQHPAGHHKHTAAGGHGARWAKRHAREERVVDGEVTAVSASGGVFGQGQLTVKQPDGTSVTVSLSDRSKAHRAVGVGKPATSEAPTKLPLGEVVTVRRVQVKQGSYWAPAVADHGFVAR